MKKYLNMISIDEIPDKMSEEDYNNFIARHKRDSELATGNVILGEDGKPIDVDNFILAGAEILLKSKLTN